MCNAPTDPEQKPTPPDEVDRLEAMHQRMKEQQEAWRKLLEHLGQLDTVRRREQNDNTNPETGTPSR